MPTQVPYLIVPAQGTAQVPGAINLAADEIEDLDITSIATRGSQSAQATVAALREAILRKQGIYVYGTGNAIVDTAAIIRGVEQATKQSKALILVGSFLIRFENAILYYWASNPAFPTYVAVPLASDLIVMGISCRIEVEPLAFVPPDTRAKLMIFGTDYNATPGTLSNIIFMNITFDFNNSRGPLGSSFVYAFGIIGVTGFCRMNIEFVVSTDSHNGRGILAANVYRWMDVNIRHDAIIQGYFLYYCYDVTLQSISFNSLAECLDIDAPCWRFNINNMSFTNLRGEGQCLDLATLSDSVISNISSDVYGQIINLYNKENSYQDFDTWLEWEYAKACTISVGSPCVITCADHHLSDGTAFGFSDVRGSPAAPLSVNTLYWARNGTADTFQASGVVSQGTLSANPFASSAASTTITVTAVAHGQSSGMWTIFNGASGFDGIPEEELNADHKILTVVDPDHYTIGITTPALTGASGGGSFVYARNQQLVTTVSPSIGVPALRLAGPMTTCDNNTILGIVGSNAAGTHASINISLPRRTMAGDSSYWRGANPRSQINGLIMDGVSLDTGVRVIINEGVGLIITNMELSNMTPNLTESQKAAFCATQSIEDALAQTDSVLDLQVDGLLVDGSTASGVSIRPGGPLSLDRVQVKNFGSLTDSTARIGLNITRVDLKNGVRNIREVMVSHGRANSTDLSITTGVNLLGVYAVNAIGPFSLLSNADGVTNFNRDPLVVFNQRSTKILDPVDTAAVATVDVPLYENKSQYARLVTAEMINLSAIVGAADYTTLSIMKSTNGTVVSMGNAVAVDQTAEAACTSRSFPFSTDTRTILSPGQVLFARFARGAATAGSTTPFLILNWYALPYDGPMVA